MADADGEGGAGNRPAPGPQDFVTYAEELGRLALYDCSGLRDALSDDEMRSLFHRHRQTGSKPVMATRTVTMTSLDQAWTSFVHRWNTKGATRFIPSLERREAEHRARSVSALVKRIHDIAYDADRDCCYMNYVRGCDWCRDNGRRRPNEDEWMQMLEDNPTAEDKGQVACRRWNRRLVCRNAIWNVLEQHRSRLPTIRHGAKPPHEVLVVRQDWTVAGNATATRTRVLEDDTMIIVPQDRLDNVASTASTIDKAERLTRLEREMADLRRELDVVQEPPREERGRQGWRKAAPWECQRR
ncbi:hypothetical protein PHMEG_00013693 [Phytophthora megakarya]|uniref:Uncharacterized protein n=1 Tax=Phytophthora megakarya TaxID=4795 RepID=A0A225W5R1_9STRA|nr:hypothetical protein PHMEG_00013693 [Phytophthora megakarya]